MKTKPNFIIAGVARCGTTSLFHYLEQHPEIGMSKIKEPKYFSSLDLELPQNGIGDKTVFSKVIVNEDSYDDLFSGLEKFKSVGEASSDCFYYHKAVIPRIKEKLGDVKMILCLRNPTERAFSAYNNLIRDSREYLNFRDGLNAEENRISENWDWMWYYKNGGLYSEAVKHFQNEFSAVKIVFFEDLELKPKRVLTHLCEFLDVNPNVSIDYSTRYSHSGKPKSKLVSLFTSRKNPLTFYLREFSLKFIPRKYLENIASSIFKKDSLDVEIEEELKSFFSKDIKELEVLTKRDLSSWL
jgi:hypothetical protein